MSLNETETAQFLAMIKLPNCKNWNGDPQYLRDLLTEARLSQRAFAKLIGVPERTFRQYLQGSHPSKCPYPVQYCLEIMAHLKDN